MKLKVFVSWSGGVAKEMAATLKAHIGLIFERADVWYSDEDIAAGDKGLNVIERELANSDFGIICVTAENQNAPWLNFEAGALSKNFDRSRVVPVIYGMEIANVTNGPLKQFQMMRFDLEGIEKILLSINEQFDPPRDENTLKTLHRKFWEDAVINMESVKDLNLDSHEPKRSLEDKIDELIERREISKVSEQQDKLLNSILFSVRRMEKAIENLGGGIEYNIPKQEMTSDRKIVSEWMQSVSLQERAFLRQAEISLNHEDETINLQYSPKHEFHAKCASKLREKLEAAFEKITGVHYILIIKIKSKGGNKPPWEESVEE